MSVKRIPFSDATAAQLREFASLTLGLEVHPSMNSVTLIAAIQKADWKNDFITLDERDEQPKPAQPRGQDPALPEDLEDDPAKDPIIQVLVSEGSDDMGKEAIYLGNGNDRILVPRGKWSPLRFRYLSPLKDAIQTIYKQDTDSLETSESHVKRHNFQVRNMPTRERLAAWHKAQMKACGQDASEEDCLRAADEWLNAA